MEKDAASTGFEPLSFQALKSRDGKAPRRKPDGGPAALTPKHRLLISYLLDGCPFPALCDRIWIERPNQTEEGAGTVRRRPLPHEPLRLLEAAELLGIKRRNARELMTLPIFQQAYNAELQRYRDGERAANLHKMVAIRDNPGLNKAADRKVQLTAAAMLNGEVGNVTNVNINNNLGTQVMQAGLVIDLRDDDEIEPATIEHEDHR